MFLFASIGGGRFPGGWGFGYMLMTTSAYVGFLLLNYYVVPTFWFKKRYFEAVGLTLSVYTMVGLCNTVLFSYTRSWMYDRVSLFQANLSFLSYGFSVAGLFMLIYALYVLVREIIFYQYKLAQVKQSLPSRITREIVLVFSIWLAILLPMLVLRGTGLMRDIGPFYFFTFPYCCIIYFLNLYWLIPGYKNNPENTGLKYFFSILGIAIAVGLIQVALLLQMRYSLTGIIILFWLIPTAISVAASWWIYWRNQETFRQLTTLQTALGNTSANLQYLRSQINPHFLFNALNTLYGTALMEKADKTGEGIQKLGDMMRFMLHENHQDKIALNRELEYLHNYIDLQNMRLALSPDMEIDIQIDEMDGYYEIAPMLLIPFIENAYKHGISLQSKSWINASLYKQGDVLHLDVHNSIHPVYMNDPERDQSGTGLANVRQRLELVYPRRHELVVRQNAKEFFVHLSITLNTIKP
ncbi:histidine kinase [Mucilaginibacter mali]|uniref:Histidine kinase n=2 Tax=Mucilaginibacter mali TaxID=2740462 RepID=A0A7D4UFV5_9SPHI|nr:histidine kinase [Mucilaginibacter mali]